MKVRCNSSSGTLKLTVGKLYDAKQHPLNNGELDVWEETGVFLCTYDAVRFDVVKDIKRMRCVDAAYAVPQLTMNAIYEVYDCGFGIVAIPSIQHNAQDAQYSVSRFDVISTKYVMCIDASETTLTHGAVYAVMFEDFSHYGVISFVGGLVSDFNKKRFRVCDAPTQSKTATTPGEVVDIEEDKLRSRWVASTILPGCCSSCNAPLPCSYHPKG